MIGKRKAQPTLFDVGALDAVRLKPGSFYAQLAAAGPTLYPDATFAALYQPGGRPSVPPSQLALLLLMQTQAGVSDQEAIERSAYDARWAVVLRQPLGEPLCAKSTLQLFRAHLVLHKKARLLLQGSLQEARKKGLLKDGPLRVAVDTLCITGAGAVKDTWNLLATGIGQVIQAAAKELREQPAAWAARQELTAYVRDPHGSVKGGLDLDWSDATAREAALAAIVADALRAWKLADALAETLGGEAAARLRQAQLLLGDLLLQDVEVKLGRDGKPQVAIKQGTEPDRIPSATDEEQRHGHKSKAHKFTGHKARTVVETQSGLILDTEVLPGNAGDAGGVLTQVQRVAQECETTVAAVLGDCAYGNGSTREEFAAAGIPLLAKVPAEARRGEFFPKSRFTLDLEAGTATCPAGKTTSEGHATTGGGWVYRFGARCEGCPLRDQCTKSPQGRTVQQHPQEALLRTARAEMSTAAGREALRERVIVEHRQARLAQLGVKRARYFGRAKTHYQLLAAATVANLRLIWNREQAPAAAATGAPPPPGGGNPGAKSLLGGWSSLCRRAGGLWEALLRATIAVERNSRLQAVWVQ